MKINDKTLLEQIGCRWFEFDWKDIAPDELSNVYQNLLLRGKKEHFIPVFIEKECSFFKWELEEYGLTEDAVNYRIFRECRLKEILSFSNEDWMKEIEKKYFYDSEDPEDILIAQSLTNPPTEEAYFQDAIDEYYERLKNPKKEDFRESLQELIHSIQYYSRYGPIVLALVPANIPYEVLLWITWGGWNDCPSPKYQLAFAKYVYEEIGAMPLALFGSELWYYLPEPILDPDTMEKIARRLIVFDNDTFEDMDVASKNIIGKKIWRLWWD